MGFILSDFVNPIGSGISSLTNSILGGAAGDAGTEGAAIQAKAGKDALKFGAKLTRPFREIGTVAGEQLPGAQFQPGFQTFNRDPSRVLNNPLFTALAEQQNQQLINQQGALGRGGSGETNDLLTQNILRLGQGFQQQDIQNQQAEFQNRISENQLQFGQLFDQTRLGANAATQQATSGQEIIQGIGNVRAAGGIADQNSRNDLLGQGLGLGAGLLLASSDVRLKENIRYAETVNGINVYTWEWNDEGKRIAGNQEQRGPLAQELIETHPESVFKGTDGYYLVDYGVLRCH